MGGDNEGIPLDSDVLDFDRRTGEHDGMTNPDQKPGSPSMREVDSGVDPEDTQTVEVDGVEYERVDESGVAPSETVRFTLLGERGIEEARRAMHDPDAPRFDNAEEVLRYFGLS